MQANTRVAIPALNTADENRAVKMLRQNQRIATAALNSGSFPNTVSDYTIRHSYSSALYSSKVAKSVQPLKNTKILEAAFRDSMPDPVPDKELCACARGKRVPRLKSIWRQTNRHDLGESMKTGETRPISQQSCPGPEPWSISRQQ